MLENMSKEQLMVIADINNELKAILSKLTGSETTPETIPSLDSLIEENRYMLTSLQTIYSVASEIRKIIVGD